MLEADVIAGLANGERRHDETDYGNREPEHEGRRPQACPIGDEPGDECHHRHRTIARRLVQAEREPALPRADQIDLHDHRDRPGEPLVDTKEDVGEDHPLPRGCPDQQQRHGYADDPARDQDGPPTVPIGQHARSQVRQRLRDAERDQERERECETPDPKIWVAISGTTVPAEAGKLTLVLPSGKAVTDVAPKTGIYSERLVLSDLGGPGDGEFGVDIAPTGDAKQGAWFSFDLRQETDCAAFGGDVSDGATIDMLCFSVNSGVVTVNDQTLKTKLKVGTNYHVDITLFSSATYGDIWALCLTNVDSGEQEWVCGAIDGGYRPVHSASLRKHAGKTGSISIDSIVLLGYQR
jgi:hypothetical protein